MGGVQRGTLCFLGETRRPAWRLPERTETKTSTSAIMSSGQKSLKLNYLDRTEGMFGVNWIQSSRNRSSWQLWSRRWKDRGLEMLCRSRTWPAPPVRGFWRTVWDHLQKTEQTGWKLRNGALIPLRCCGLAERLLNISQPHESCAEDGSKRSN